MEMVDWADAPDDLSQSHYAAGVAVTGGKLIFLSGCTAAPAYHSHPHRPKEFDEMPQDMEGQTRVCLDKIKKSLEAAGGTLDDVVEATYFLRDMTAHGDMVKVRKEYFGNHRPASTCVQVVRMATDPRCLIEIKVVAVVDGRESE
jgi:2-iminobutanoate/2-iminopropanoate deaminase